jgi:oligopeptide transport system substrate-binding protein
LVIGLLAVGLSPMIGAQAPLANAPDHQPQPDSASFFSDEPTLKMAISAGPIEWNPIRSYSALEAQLYTAVYEGLVAYHPLTQRPIPAVAESWDISADHLTYTFHLRPNVTYSNGDPVLAKHFRDSWLAMLALGQNTSFGSLLDPIKGAADLRTGKTTDTGVFGVTAPDDHTLVIQLAQPAAWFLQVLCHQSLVAIHPAMLKLSDWSTATSLIGNGPYILEKATPEQFSFVRNELYWDHANVTVKRIEILRSENFVELTARFNSHDLQWLAGGAEYDKLTNRSTILVTPQFSTSFYFFNQRNAIFQNPAVRKGLTLLLNLEDLRSTEHNIVPSKRLIPAIPYYPDVASIDKQDKVAGLKQLADAGYPNGKGLPPLIIKLAKGDDNQKTLQFFKDAWGSLDTTVDLVEQDPDSYVEQLQTDNYAVGILSWIGDYSDPLTFLDLFSTNGSLNIAGNHDTEFQDLLSASATQTGTTRYKTLAKAEERLLLQATCIPISNSPSFNVIDLEQVDGWYQNPFDVHPFRYLKPKSAKPPRNVALADPLTQVASLGIVGQYAH